ncbi:hypothetical protein QWJ07_32890 [Frankia sp. RB7]|nr:hypothetical protein [Frankia sp. RB7]
MHERARRIFDEARAALARTADVVVEHRVHDDDGMLTEWSRNMPKKAPPPTMEQVEAKIADAQVGTDSKIAAALAAHDELWHDVIGMLIAGERKKMRAEVQKLREEHDLRISALLQGTEKLERGLGDRGAVVELPNPLRSRRG